jgi:hypothetical protein
MYYYTPKESDWKIFRKRVPEWRERYLARKNREIMDILDHGGATPTDRFWAAEHRIRSEAKILYKCLDGHSRSKMLSYLLLMYGHQLIAEADVAEFSEELRDILATPFGIVVDVERDSASENDRR